MNVMSIDPIQINNFPLIRSGKVRDIYEIPEKIDGIECLLFVASDRMSAFDVVLPKPIPDKGKVLTQISQFWFDYFNDVENHSISSDFDVICEKLPALKEYDAQLRDRTVLVKKSKPLAIECVVRGYLAGSGWKEYKADKSVCGISLPDGLVESSQLPEVIFTPATKAEEGHDENINEERAREIVGDAIFDEVSTKSIEIYNKGREYAKERGIILCDTKFEFGEYDGRIILIDEVLTPDSSRFWPADDYAEGQSQKSFDKQYVRDYLETLDWDKTPPGPELPDDVIANTREKYLQSYELITGKKLDV